MATMAGLVLNCANSALYMANYNLVVRCCSRFRRHPIVHLSETLRAKPACPQAGSHACFLSALTIAACIPSQACS